MALKNEDLRLRIIVNGDDGRHRIIEIQKKIDETRQLLQKLNKEPVVNKDSIASAKGLLTKYTHELEVARRQLQISSMTMAELTAHSRNLNAVLRQTDPNSPLWHKLNSELKSTNLRLKELRMGASVTGDALRQMQVVVTSISASFHILNRIKNTLGNASNAFVDFDAAVTAAMKTTGLSRDQMLEVSKALDSIDTRTGSSDNRGGTAAGYAAQHQLRGHVSGNGPCSRRLYIYIFCHSCCIRQR